jgi:hypothetical protein
LQTGAGRKNSRQAIDCDHRSAKTSEKQGNTAQKKLFRKEFKNFERGEGEISRHIEI